MCVYHMTVYTSLCNRVKCVCGPIMPHTGDKWCLCAGRWFEAHEAGCAPPLYLKATHIKVQRHLDQ